LGSIGPEAASAVPALLRSSLKDKYGGARAKAIYSLLAIDPGAKGLAAVLVTALADEDGRARHAAASTLAQVHPVAKEAVPALHQALKDENGYISLAAAVSLSRIDSESKPQLVPILIGLLKAHEAPVRIGAATLLEDIDPAAAAKAGLR
jgi:HEAT repeat protein